MLFALCVTSKEVVVKEAEKAVLVYNKEFGRHSYGPYHPLKVERLQLTMDLIKAYGLCTSADTPWIEAQKADERDLLRIHSQNYIDILKTANSGQAPPKAWDYGLGSGDNPVFPGVYDWSLMVTGATLESIRQVRENNRQIAFNIAGGLHHAMRSRASGFCYLNDPAIGIARMVADGLRVVYLDIDVHHGDGVQDAFYHTDQVLTISLHQHGHTLFPGTGFPDEIGEGPGRGYAVNVPLAPGTGDDLYLWAFMEVVPPLVRAFDPDILMTQLGADALGTDPLAALDLTTDGFFELIREIKSWNIKWVALGGGGYNIMNVARAWTRAWAVMKDTDIPDALPEAFVNAHRMDLGNVTTLSDSRPKIGEAVSGRAKQLAEATVDMVKEKVFPLVGV
jgi:acetoin utilization protein AcuC